MRMVTAQLVCSALLLAIGVRGRSLQINKAASYTTGDRQGVIMSRKKLNGKRYCITARVVGNVKYVVDCPKGVDPSECRPKPDRVNTGLVMEECNGDLGQQWRLSKKYNMLENGLGYYMESSGKSRDNLHTAKKSMNTKYKVTDSYWIDLVHPRQEQTFAYDPKSGYLVQVKDGRTMVVDWNLSRMTAQLWTAKDLDNMRWDFVVMSPNMSSRNGKWEDVSCSSGRCKCERGTMRQYKPPVDSNGCGSERFAFFNFIQERLDAINYLTFFAFSVDFDNKPCCHAHDACYSTVGKTHRGCDLEFVQCLDPHLWWMWLGVAALGEESYYGAQKGSVKCWVEGAGRRLMDEVQNSDPAEPADNGAIDADPSGEDLTFIPFNPDLATEEGFHKGITEGYFDGTPPTVTVHLEMDNRMHELVEADKISELVGKKPAGLGLIADLERRIKDLEEKE